MTSKNICALTVLPDINILLALYDESHPNHEIACHWRETIRSGCWAACPITENGFIRLSSAAVLPSKRRLSPAQAIKELENLIASLETEHQFWPDDVSLLDKSLFHPRAIQGHNQITDVYLLGLCQKHGGTLVTLDERITTAAIVDPHPQLLRFLR